MVSAWCACCFAHLLVWPGDVFVHGKAKTTRKNTATATSRRENSETRQKLKKDGWVLPSTERIDLRSIADLVLYELNQQDKGGSHVDLKFVGRSSDTLLSWNAPLFEPCSNVAKLAFRCWGKTTQGAAAMMTKMEKE